MNNNRYRPLLSGAQLYSYDETTNRSNYGTLGAFVNIKINGLLCVLTAAHIFGHEYIQVYQPDNSAMSGANAIGVSQTSIISEVVDAAIAELQTPITYSSQIIDIGVMTGSYTWTPGDGPFPDPSNQKSWVRKYGRTTGATDGYIDNLNYSGTDSGGTKFRDQLGIKNRGSNPFALGGDSGAAVVTMSGQAKECQMVGLLILGGPTYAGATPIQAVFEAFSEAGIALELAIMPPSVEARAGILSLRDLEAQVVSELEQSATGRRLLAFYRQHGEHLADLVHHDEAVAAVWATNGGRALLTGLYNAMQDRSSQVLPTMLGEMPVAVALEQIALALKTAGRASLADGIEQIRPVVMDALGKSWPETLSSFVNEQEDETEEDDA